MSYHKKGVCVIIYLASPYSHPNPEVKRLRFEAVSKAAAFYMEKGHIIFSPIAMTHPMSLYGNLTGDWAFWKHFDSTFLSHCIAMWILKLTGWDESVGIKGEIEFCGANDILVQYIKLSDCKVGDVIPDEIAFPEHFDMKGL